jgi:ParB family chromosome partitioning protein
MAAAKRGGLGRGLDALFVDNESADEKNEPAELRVSEIEPDREQPRRSFDDESLAELADSIAKHGVIQPILVRPMPEGGYRIVAGERRWRASRLAGKSTIPAIVRDIDRAEAMTLALIENLQREDLNPVEEAMGYRQLMEVSGLTQEDMAKRVGRSRPAVANALRLLSLPEETLRLLRDGQLTAGHAKAILAISGKTRQNEVAQMVARDGLTVREAEKISRQAGKPPKAGAAKARDRTAAEVELSLRAALGVEVRVKYSDGRGTLSLDFYSREQLFDFANRLGK